MFSLAISISFKPVQDATKPAPISFTEAGMLSFCKELHFLNACAPMETMPSCRSTSSREGQQLNARSPIFSTLPGTTTFFRLSHCPKTIYGIVVTPSSKITVSTVDPARIRSPIETTPAGIASSLMLVELNAFAPIFFRFFESVNFVIPLHRSNPKLSISITESTTWTSPR